MTEVGSPKRRRRASSRSHTRSQPRRFSAPVSTSVSEASSARSSARAASTWARSASRTRPRSLLSTWMIGSWSVRSAAWRWGSRPQIVPEQGAVAASQRDADVRADGHLLRHPCRRVGRDRHGIGGDRRPLAGQHAHAQGVGPWVRVAGGEPVGVVAHLQVELGLAVETGHRPVPERHGDLEVVDHQGTGLLERRSRRGGTGWTAQRRSDVAARRRAHWKPS